MFAAPFFRIFWVFLLYDFVTMGVTLAMVAGVTLARGEFVSAAVATLLAAVCGLLCGQTHEAYRGG